MTAASEPKTKFQFLENPKTKQLRGFHSPKISKVFKTLSYFPKNKIFTTQAYDVFIITLASKIKI